MAATKASTSQVLRVAGAVCVLLGGSVHLQQWLVLYKDIDIGPSFLGNVAASVVIGAALLAFNHRLPALAGLGLAVSSLGALFASRTIGLLGFEEKSYDTAAVEAIVVEVLAVVLLGLYLLTARPEPSHQSSVRS